MYHVESELGITLSPEITYSYRFVAVVDGIDYFSNYDIFMLKEYQPNEQKLTSYLSGDMNQNGQLKLNDAIYMRRYAVGWDVVLK